MAYSEFYEFRRLLSDALIRDLVGPKDPDEVETIYDPPLTKYISGTLYPQTDAVMDTSLDIDVADDDGGDEGAAPDPPVAMAHLRFPSSMGLTFAVDTNSTQSIVVEVTAARYDKVVDDDSALNLKRPRRGGLGPTEPWRRIPLVISPEEIKVNLPVANGRKELTPYGLVARALQNWLIEMTAMPGCAKQEYRLLSAYESANFGIL